MASTASSAWSKLDTAGNLYPAIESLRYPALFRLKAVCRQEFDRDLLEQAAGRVLMRFPFFKVRLRRGLFWFLLEDNPKEIILWDDAGLPCRPIPRKKNNDYLFRIFHRENTLSIEFFHALTDGYGAIVFFKTLIAEYLRLSGTASVNGYGIPDPDQPVEPEEMENAFIRYYYGKRKRLMKEPVVFHIRGSHLSSNNLKTITGELSIDDARKLAGDSGTTITEYFAAVLVQALYQLQREQRPKRRPRAIRISVPVNMRTMFPSKTLRNFSQFIKPGIDPELGDYTFTEILHQIHHAIQYEKSEKYLSAVWSSHVSLELNPVIRATPLPLKNLVMNIIFNYFGENRFSATISNLGLIAIPSPLQEFIDHFDFIIGPNPINPVNCAVIGYNGRLRITFSRNIEETALERHFFSHFIDAGIPVSIETI